MKSSLVRSTSNESNDISACSSLKISIRTTRNWIEVKLRLKRWNRIYVRFSFVDISSMQHSRHPVRNALSHIVSDECNMIAYRYRLLPASSTPSRLNRAQIQAGSTRIWRAQRSGERRVHTEAGGISLWSPGFV